MAGDTGNGLSRQDKMWALAAAIPFLVSLAVLGIAINRGTFLEFAIGWPVLQILFYFGAIKQAGGAIDHPLVKTQVMLHWMMLALLIAIIARAT